MGQGAEIRRGPEEGQERSVEEKGEHEKERHRVISVGAHCFLFFLFFFLFMEVDDGILRYWYPFLFSVLDAPLILFWMGFPDFFFLFYSLAFEDPIMIGSRFPHTAGVYSGLVWFVFVLDARCLGKRACLCL